MSFNSMDQMNKGKGGYAAAVPKKRKPKSNENTKVVSLNQKAGFNLFSLIQHC